MKPDHFSIKCGIVSLFWGIISLLSVFGQNTYSAGVHYGRMLKINPLWPEITHNARSLELSISRPTSGKHSWHGLFRYPEIGITALYIQPGNPEVFGQVFTVTPMLSFKLIERNQYKLKVSLGSSLGFATRPFDFLTNSANNVVSSKLNSIDLLRLESTWYPKGKFTYTVGLSYFHLSNAHTRVPNLGINIPSLNFIVGYRKPSPSVEKKKPIELPSGFGKLHLGARIGYGRNSFKTPGGPSFPVYVGSIYLNSIWQNRFRFKLGTEWFWAESQYAFIRNQSIPSENAIRDAVGGLVFFGTEFLFGRIALVAHIGPYLKRAYLMDHLIYTKLGVQGYLFNQQENPRFQPYLGIFVHSHSGEADFAEFGLGFVF